MTDPDRTLTHSPVRIEDGRSSRWAAVLARIPTGAKLFLILSGALLPLAIIAIGATLQTTRIADQESRARLRVAAAESSRALAIELIGDMTALRVALNALDADPGDAPSCARVQGVFAAQVAAGSRFAITDGDGRLVCGTGGLGGMTLPELSGAGPISTAIVPGQGIVLDMMADRHRTRAAAFFPARYLAENTRPSAFTRAYSSEVVSGDASLALTSTDANPFARRETQRVPLGIGGLALQMSVRSPPITSPFLLALLLPLVMWAAAAGIGWFVVDRLLIRPLQRLRRSVASYVPGEVIDMGEVRAIPAQEIRELGATFRAISRTVALHETGLAEGLVRQTRLTREVHHRVKNNLQVISSLINLHARAARSDEALAAYATIQRRVDALSVVHRNHFAEMEEHRGLNIRSVIGELATNIRATAPERLRHLGITIDLQPFLVTQDVAVAVAFLVTELVELASRLNPSAQVRVSVREDTGTQAILRVSSPALTDGQTLTDELAERYGRVLDGLSRQLRSKLHYDPLVGAYEIAIAVVGRE